MQRGISEVVKIGNSVTPFQSARKSPAVDKTASDFDNANLKVKKIRRLIKRGTYELNNVQIHHTVVRKYWTLNEF